MLDKEVFFTGMENLLRFYPNWRIKLDDVNVSKSWYEQFSYMQDRSFEIMINNYIRGENFNPTVSGLLKHSVEDEVYRPDSVEITEDDYL